MKTEMIDVSPEELGLESTPVGSLLQSGLQEVRMDRLGFAVPGEKYSFSRPQIAEKSGTVSSTLLEMLNRTPVSPQWGINE